jgi:hypothetical protein
VIHNGRELLCHKHQLQLRNKTLKISVCTVVCISSMNYSKPLTNKDLLIQAKINMKNYLLNVKNMRICSLYPALTLAIQSYYDKGIPPITIVGVQPMDNKVISLYFPWLSSYRLGYFWQPKEQYMCGHYFGCITVFMYSHLTHTVLSPTNMDWPNLSLCRNLTLAFKEAFTAFKKVNTIWIC